ncbi:MAG: methyltransferase family protein [Candidatus Geothermarchaeales archaeon]
MLEARVVHLASVVILVFSAVLLLMARERLKGVHSSDEGERISAVPPTAVELAWTATNVAVVFFVLVPPFLPSLVYGNFLTMPLPYSSAFQLAGLVILAIGGILGFWSADSLGRFLVRRIRVVVDHELVRRGPYARIRHPMYTAMVMLVVGLTLLYLNAVLPIVLVLAVWAAFVRARTEERLLASSEAFGEEYREYLRTTGMFLPKLRRRN